MDTVIVGASEVAHLSKSNGENGRIDGELMLNREAHVTDDLASGVVTCLLYTSDAADE